MRRLWSVLSAPPSIDFVFVKVMLYSIALGQLLDARGWKQRLVIVAFMGAATLAGFTYGVSRQVPNAPLDDPNGDGKGKD